MPVGHSRRITPHETVNVTIQEQFTFDWKENFGELEVPEMHFLKIETPQSATKSPDESTAAGFSEVDTEILANLEEDLRENASRIHKLRHELKLEKFCQEWLKKEINRYHRASEGLDARSTGSEESEMGLDTDDDTDVVMDKGSLDTPRGSMEMETDETDEGDEARCPGGDEDRREEAMHKPLYDNRPTLAALHDDSSDEDIEGIYENLDFLRKMHNGNVSNEDSEGEDVFARSPDPDRPLTTSMRVSTLIDFNKPTVVDGHQHLPPRPLKRTPARPAPVPPRRNDMPTSSDKSDDTRNTASDSNASSASLSPNKGGRPASSPGINDHPTISLQRPAGIVVTPAGSSSPEPESPTKEQLAHRLSSPEVEILNVRRILLCGTLESELKYVHTMEELQKMMKTFKANMTTSKPILSAEDYDTLFFKIPELCEVHREFCNHMEPKLAQWTPEQTYGDSFKLLASHFGVHEEYIANYKKAMSCLERLKKEDERFAAISASIKLHSGDTYTMESMLNTPLQRITKLTMLLSDLLIRTPPAHEDYSILAQVLEKTRTFFKQIDDATRETDTSKQKRRLIKESYLVEFSEERKLRHVLLWSDLIICAKEKPVSGMFHREKAQYDCQWYMPLTELSLTPNERSEVPGKITNMSDQELDELKKAITDLKASIRKETNSGVRQSKQLTKTLEAKKKELTTNEGKVIIESPKLPLHLYHHQGKTYTLLMSSDYERSEWKEAILTAKRECRVTPSLTPYHIEKLLTKCKRGRKINNIGSILIKDEEELLFGTLHVTVLQAMGLKVPAQLYCCVEVDSYGIISLRARTRKSENSKTPTWNQEFGLEVEGTQTLRILCYDYTKGLEDEMIDKGAKTLSKSEIGKKEFNTTIKMEKLEIAVTLRFESTEKVLKRVQSKKKMGVFGVRICTLCKREGTNIPNIVRLCVEEVEKRGMLEMGIYRISGSSADIQKLKKLFEINSKHTQVKVQQAEIHAVAGLIKHYFRELPEPLFTQALYSKFVDGMALADPDSKRELMVSVMKSIPEPNKSVIFCLINHLRRIAQNDATNKMHLHNLATVFGPTLIGPAPKRVDAGSASPSPGFGISDAMTQVGILYYYLEHYSHGNM
ncbi:active breakpoint cluster region-related protein-like isoform X2 [Acanthaster planci]|uniref:Active breakpoint cluster region-related protein-like isoform X2 n=1 Tax=Acanthaster planci TaxID=133434 RepID=A0A8B7YSC4_ACAPL|nr:active breakpoint cluster region-related protein-like isoform X2 [Acanthaster planci]